MNQLFINTTSGADFSFDRKYRYTLWRIWDDTRPYIMFIGLNPSTANEDQPDPTIRSCTRITKVLGYGGFYMLNCFPFISAYPEILEKEYRRPGSMLHNQNSDFKIQTIGKNAAKIIFAWGNFDIVRTTGRDVELCTYFPNAVCLAKNKNGSPKHPLYVSSKNLNLVAYNEII